MPLGAQPGSTPKLVLLIRGQLLERFPTLVDLRVPDRRAGEPSRRSSPPVRGHDDPKEMDPNRMILPVMNGHLIRTSPTSASTSSPTQIDKFFFILEEHMTEPRFGFDEPDGDGRDGKTWLDVDWSEVGVAAGRVLRQPRTLEASPTRRETSRSGSIRMRRTVADALLQRPFRGY